MDIHPKDKLSLNPRMQCSVCGRWKRMNGWEYHPDGSRTQVQRFCACGYGNGDHLAGDGVTVCEDCCQTACRKIAESRSAA